MAQFETISHGEANWEQKVNKNFSNVTQNSGWKKIDLIAPAEGNLMFCLFNGVVFFNGAVKTNDTGTVKIGYLPKQIGSKTLLAQDIASNAVVLVKNSPDNGLTITTQNPDMYVAMDGVSSFQGYIDLTDLGG